MIQVDSCADSSHTQSVHLQKNGATRESRLFKVGFDLIATAAATHDAQVKTCFIFSVSNLDGPDASGE